MESTAPQDVPDPGMCWSPHVEAAARAIFEYLRNGPQADTEWDQLPWEVEFRFCAAARRALVAFMASATADIEPWQ